MINSFLQKKDTDSLYMAISRPNFEIFEKECVKDGLEEEYKNTRNLYLPRNDSEANKKFDQRKLGKHI